MDSLETLTPIRKPPSSSVAAASGLGEGLLALLGLSAGGALAASWQQWQLAVGPDLLSWLACISALLGALALVNLADLNFPARWLPEQAFIGLALAWALLGGALLASLPRLFLLFRDYAEAQARLDPAAAAIVGGLLGALLAWPLLALWQAALALACPSGADNQPRLRRLLGLAGLAVVAGLGLARLELRLPGLSARDALILLQLGPFGLAALTVWLASKQSLVWPSRFYHMEHPSPSAPLALGVAAGGGFLAGAAALALLRAVPLLLPWPFYGFAPLFIWLGAFFSLGMYWPPLATRGATEHSLGTRFAASALALLVLMPYFQIAPGLVAGGKPWLALALWLALAGLPAWLLGGAIGAGAFRSCYGPQRARHFGLLLLTGFLVGAWLADWQLARLLGPQLALMAIACLTAATGLFFGGLRPSARDAHSHWPLLLAALSCLVLFLAPRWALGRIILPEVEGVQVVSQSASMRGWLVVCSEESGAMTLSYQGETLTRQDGNSPPALEFAEVLAQLASDEAGARAVYRTVCAEEAFSPSNATTGCWDVFAESVDTAPRLLPGGPVRLAEEASPMALCYGAGRLRLDSGDPWELTSEDYARLKEVLGPQGIFTRVISLDRLDRDSFGRLCQTLNQAFPEGEFWFAGQDQLVFIGGPGYQGLNTEALELELALDATAQDRMQSFGLTNGAALLACRIGKVSEFAVGSPFTSANLATWRPKPSATPLFAALIAPRLNFNQVISELSLAEEDPLARAEALRDLAGFYWKRGLPEAALGAWRAAWQVDTDNLLPAFELIQAQLDLKLLADASETLEQADRASRGNAKLDFLWGRLREAEGKLPAAEASYKRARDAAPTIAEYRDALWAVRKKQGKSPW